MERGVSPRYPGSHSGQQDIKLGPVQPEVPLEHVVVKPQLLSQPVKCPVVFARAGNGMNPESTLSSPAVVEQGDECDPLSVTVIHNAGGIMA